MAHSHTFELNGTTITTTEDEGGLHSHKAIMPDGTEVETGQSDGDATDSHNHVLNLSGFMLTSGPPGGGSAEPVEMGKRLHFDKAKGVWSARLPIVCKNTDRQQAFGWSSVVVDELGRVVVDHDDDIISVGELEKAAYAYVLTKRDASDMHQRRGVGDLIESVVLTQEKRRAMGLPVGQVGWWVGFHVTDREVWAKVKSGEYSEFSIGGSARRVPTEVVGRAV